MLWHQLHLAGTMLRAGRDSRAATATWLQSHLRVNALAAAVCALAVRDVMERIRLARE